MYNNLFPKSDIILSDAKYLFSRFMYQQFILSSYDRRQFLHLLITSSAKPRKFYFFIAVIQDSYPMFLCMQYYDALMHTLKVLFCVIFFLLI